jgi:hypothetical protein
MKKTKTSQLAFALALAQAEISSAELTKENTFTKSKYADLASVWDAVRDPLTRNGLAVSQIFETLEDGNIRLRTVLLHTSGEQLSSTLPLLGVKDHHSLGSASTYVRRYALAAITGCAPGGWDDDGNAAQESITKSPARLSKSSRSLPRTKARSTTPPPRLSALEILEKVPEADEWLRNKEVDPGDPPLPVCERIVTLGVEGLKKTIEDDRKKQEKAKKAEAIIADADRVEPIEDKKEEAKQ